MFRVMVQHYGKHAEKMHETDSEQNALDFKRDQCEVLKGYHKRTGILPDGTFVVFGSYQGMDDVMKTRIWIQKVTK